MPKESTEPIYIGCELFVRKGNTLLLSLRSKKRYGAGTWCVPGGHMEHGERLVEAVCREALEELGARVGPSDLRLASIADTFRHGKDTEHHVHVTFELRDPSWEPRNTEPDDCDELRYFPLDSLPDNIFPPHKEIIANYLAGRLYDDTTKH
jgi:8-oxo-dGTP diphosphatase